MTTQAVSDALRRAADRSARRAELEVARLTVERNVGYEPDEAQLKDQAATGATVKPSLKHTCSKGDLHPVSPSSTTAGSPGDSKAGEHVDKGDQASPSAPPAAPTCPVPARPTLARVGSVPILAPATPADKIRRTSTPSTVSYPVNTGNVASPVPTETNEDHGQSTPEEPAGNTQKRTKTTKNKRKRRKQQKENAAFDANTQAAEQTEHDDAWEENNETWWPDEGAGMSWPEDAVVSGPADERNTANSHDHQDEAPPKKKAKKEASPRPAAKKAAAKPKPSTALVPVKAEPATKPEPSARRTPARTETREEMARAEAFHDNLNRASTGSQLAATPRNAPDPDDIEEALDREIKKEEPQPSTHDIQASSQAPQPQPRVTPPAPQAEGHPGDGDSQQQQQQNIDDKQGHKKERIKTPAEKAAHARYMRFSRSFDRSLDTKRIMN
eukprot:s1914_g8.t1